MVLQPPVATTTPHLPSQLPLRCHLSLQDLIKYKDGNIHLRCKLFLGFELNRSQLSLLLAVTHLGHAPCLQTCARSPRQLVRPLALAVACRSSTYLRSANVDPLVTAFARVRIFDLIFVPPNGLHFVSSCFAFNSLLSSSCESSIVPIHRGFPPQLARL